MISADGDDPGVALWRCAVCAEENRDAPNCWACGRPRPRVDWARTVRRIAAIAVGVALQVAAGVLIWLLPPGASMWSWAAYLGMGIVGFLHIFIGGEMLVARRSASCNATRSVAALPEPVFSTASLKFEDHRCPRCEASVSRAIDRGIRRCASCGESFSIRELGWPHADPAGEPTTFGPGELRISGAAVVAALVVMAVGVVIALVAVGGSWP